jgi:DNA polymerase-3 subunit gamma/tau
VLPVVESREARTMQRPSVGGPASIPASGRPAAEVVGVPVRVQPESPREALAAAVATVIPTEEGDFWHATVADLVAREAVTALVRELALQSQLQGRDQGHWMLRVERESLNQPAARERLQAALQGAGHAVSLSVEVGMVTDSPARRNAAAAAEKQRAAEEIIRGDPFVQDMMRDFGAKIVPGSIKPVPTIK